MDHIITSHRLCTCQPLVSKLSNALEMKKKAKKTQGKQTRGHPKRPQVPIYKSATAPSWCRPWISTSTDEYDERTVSAEYYAENEAWCKWHCLPPRTEEEEEQ